MYASASTRVAQAPRSRKGRRTVERPTAPSDVRSYSRYLGYSGYFTTVIRPVAGAASGAVAEEWAAR